MTRTSSADSLTSTCQAVLCRFRINVCGRTRFFFPRSDLDSSSSLQLQNATDDGTAAEPYRGHNHVPGARYNRFHTNPVRYHFLLRTMDVRRERVLRLCHVDHHRLRGLRRRYVHNAKGDLFAVHNKIQTRDGIIPNDSWFILMKLQNNNNNKK